MSFSLATVEADGRPTPILIVDDRLYPIEEVAPEVLGDCADGLIDVIRRWEKTEPALIEVAERLGEGPREDLAVPAPDRLEEWLTPLRYPAKVLATGYNYRDHVVGDAGRADFVKADNVPTFFLKPPTTTLVGQGRSVRYPTQSSQLDYEIELAVIIGRRGRRISVADAMDYVAGYSIALDLSARDWQRHPKHTAKFDLFGGKAFDDSCPLGPTIVPSRYVKVADLRLRLAVNGEVRQDAGADQMIWPIAEQIHLMSEHLTLEPGDVILTGTPSGVGLATGNWLQIGDRLEAQIVGLGSLQVHISEDSGS